MARRAFGPVAAQAGERGGGRLDRAVDVGAAGGRRPGRDLAGDRVQPLELGLALRLGLGPVDQHRDVHCSPPLRRSLFRAVVVLWR